MILNLLTIFQILHVANFLRLTIFSQECQIYFKKLATYDINTETITQKKFSQFIIIDIGYKDSLYFYNNTYFGLVQEDGKTPEETCFDLKIIQYQNEQYIDGIELQSLSISSYHNNTTLERFYSFQIKLTELQIDLIQSNSDINFIAQGYFEAIILAAETTQIVNSIQIHFKIPLTTTIVKSQSYSNSNENSTQVYTIVSECRICTDFECSNFSHHSLHQNDEVFILQKVKLESVSHYYLTNPTVQFISDDFNKEADIIEFNNTTPGEIKIKLVVNVFGNEVQIFVNSIISPAVNDTEKLHWFSNIANNVTGTIGESICIDKQGDEYCYSNYGDADEASGDNIFRFFFSLFLPKVLIILL